MNESAAGAGPVPGFAGAAGHRPTGAAGVGHDASTASAADTPTDTLGDLRTALGDRLLTDADSLAAYAVDSSRAQPEGLPLAVVRATSTGDVSTALAWAHARGIRVSVRGAGTGLSGGPWRTPAAWSSRSRR